MSAGPRVRSRPTSLGLYFLFKNPLFFSFSINKIQSTLIFIGMEVKILKSFSSVFILTFDNKDCLTKVLYFEETLF